MTKIRAERVEERDHGGKRVRVTVVEREPTPEEAEQEERRRKEADWEARLADLERRVEALEKQRAK